MIDKLRTRNVTIVNGCPMCLQNVEYVDPLLLHCEVAECLWRSILSWFDYSWVSQNSMGAFYRAWMMGVGSARRRIMWKASFSFSIFFWQSFGLFGKKETLGTSKVTLPPRRF